MIILIRTLVNVATTAVVVTSGVYIVKAVKKLRTAKWEKVDVTDGTSVSVEFKGFKD
jgi:hypothetical protein